MPKSLFRRRLRPSTSWLTTLAIKNNPLQYDCRTPLTFAKERQLTGLRYSDISSLMWGNIQHTSLGQEIVIDSMQKTKYSVRIPLSFHVARHTFATSAIAAGGDLYTVCKLLGHKDIQTTQIYADVIMPTRIDAVNRLSDFFGLVN